MARQLTPLGRLLLVACGLALVGYGRYRYGVVEKRAAIVAPEKKPEGTVSKADSATSPAPGEPGATVAATPGTTGKAGLAGGARLARPIKVAIVTWGGYAGGIVANGGFAPNKESLFFKDFGIQVELLVIDDFEKSRDAFRAGGDKGGVDIMWSTVDAYALEYGGVGGVPPEPRRPLGPPHLGGGSGQRLQGGTGRRRGFLVARRLHRGARARGGPHPGLDQGGQQPDRRHLRGPRRVPRSAPRR